MRLAAALFLALVSVMGALAQNAAITALVGNVVDPGGAAVAGAKVIAVNKNTQDIYNTTTNDQGFYRIEFIRIGISEWKVN